MNFTKMQGAGNDFVLIETQDKHRDWSKLAITLCDRHFGIGADTLLLLMPSDVAHFKMRIFDADGSEAETCGNGTRCLAKYIFGKGLINKGVDQISIETLGGIRTVKFEEEKGKLIKIQADMGKPKFQAEYIPVVIKKGEDNVVDIKSMLSCSTVVERMKLTLNLISMGNPHAVYFWQHPVSDFPLSELGPKVEHLAIFPNRTNFEVARILSRQQIEARVWERGVGETLACGSGACAITVAALLLGYIGHEVNVKLPGGVLKVEWDGTGGVMLGGPAEIVFKGEWPS